MMRFPLWLLPLTMVLSGCHSFEPKVEILRWKENKQAAVALTFDDWTPGHPAIVVPELQKRGMVATFNVITANVKDWEPLRHAASLGNEIANHTTTHPHPYGISFEDEVAAAERKIEAEIPGYKVYTFAYPYGETTDSLKQYLAENGYWAARGTNTPMTDDDFAADTHLRDPQRASDSSKVNGPIDYMDTKTYSVLSETPLSDYAEQLNHAKRVGGMVTFLYHSVYNDSIRDFSYAWITDTVLRQQLDTLASLDLWVTTYADMMHYLRQYANTTIEKVKSSSNEYVFRLKERQPKIFGDAYRPLSILVTVPNAEHITVLQNTDKLGDSSSLQEIVKAYGTEKAEIKPNGSLQLPVTIIQPNQILFNAIPNIGDITLIVQPSH